MYNVWIFNTKIAGNNKYLLLVPTYSCKMENIARNLKGKKAHGSYILRTT